ncbi:MAG TPA: BTAD domain-containing putative transcriptional regulator [Actinomycetospora sp.]|uniref:BTAD domain-containing putative transcriptional regulator n=1 Tax=Actinomycetospora sp. TaxID=1872135 RepID=UPI002F3E8D15
MEARLDLATERPICLVTGSAGWGKTTAVRMWARGRPAAWVSARDHRLSSRRLLPSLAGALDPFVPAPRGDLVTGASGDEPPAWDHVVDLVRWLEAGLRDDVVLVVDDLVELSSDVSAVHLLGALCQLLPERLHLVLLTRSEPPLHLERLHGQGLIAEIDATQLAFGVEEIGELLRVAMGEDCPGLAAQLFEQTGGWPAAVCRTVEVLGGASLEEGRRAALRVTAPGQRFRIFLGGEVIGAESERVRELLSRLAVLGTVEPPAEPALGVADADGQLTELARRGLVRQPDPPGVGWSLIPVLGRFIASELEHSPAEHEFVHRQVAQLSANQNSYARVLRLLLAANDYEGCVTALAEHGFALLNGGQIDVVLEVVEQLPLRYLDDRRVQLVLGRGRQLKGQWARALECFRRAQDDSDELDPQLAWSMGLVAYSVGDFADVLAFCRRGRLGTGDVADESRLLSMAASASRMMGDYERSRAQLERALVLAERCHDPAAWADAYGVRAMLAAADGDRRRAESYSIAGMEAAEAAGDLPQTHRLRVLRAFHLVEQGRAADALAQVETAAAVAELCAEARLTAHTLAVRGVAKARLGRLAEGVDDLSSARDQFEQVGSRFLAWPLCALGDVYRLRGQLARARAAYEEAIGIAEPARDVLVLASALAGLARVRAIDDVSLARDLAKQAVALGEGLREIPSLLARGWVELSAGCRDAATRYAARAAAAARMRGEQPGLAEALTLNVLASESPASHVGLLTEAIEMWRCAGCRIEEGIARLVAARLTGALGDSAVELSAQALRDQGVSLGPAPAAGPLAALVRTGPIVSIRALGVFQIYRDGEAIPKAAWQSKKARDLLKILVAWRRPVRREQLMELLWPGVARATAAPRLSVLLSIVRDVLAPGAAPTDDGPLASDDNVVWLVNVVVDVEVFLARAQAARTQHQRGAGDPLTALADAEALCTGSFLEDDPYQDWAAQVSDELQEMHVFLLRALVERLRDHNDVDGVSYYALRLLEHDPFDEQIHLDLIHALLRAGRFGDARRRYATYVRQMAEISIEPRPFPKARLNPERPAVAQAKPGSSDTAITSRFGRPRGTS